MMAVSVSVVRNLTPVSRVDDEAGRRGGLALLQRKGGTATTVASRRPLEGGVVNPKPHWRRRVVENMARVRLAMVALVWLLFAACSGSGCTTVGQRRYEPNC